MRRITAFVVFLTVSSGALPATAQATRPSATPQKSPPAKIESGRPQPVTQVDAKRALAMRMPETKLTDARLEDAIAFLQDTSGANIHVNWRALESVNITRETPVTLRMSPMPLRKLLKYVLTEADGQNLATFYADDGVIQVTTRELSDQRLITKVYPVEDLLLTIPDFTDAPQFQLQGTQTSGGGGGGGSGQSLLGSGNLGQEENTRAGKNQRGQELVQLVMDTVQPEVWRENGGTSSIRFFRGRLIVTAPPSVHEQIGGAID
ncbi:MAG TPA: hypothetical protein VGR35_14645 [Tepidisphaeraceae bacterium]|nr:hypothetical protein [Tepidisphaeraceae bacterium]